MNPPQNSTALQTKGYINALVGTALWSSTAIFIRHLTESNLLPAIVLAFWREFLVSLTLILVLRLIRPNLIRLPKSHLSFLVLYGFILMLFNAVWTVSVALNGAAVATVLCYSSPAITALIAWRLWGEPLGLRTILAITLGLTGCIILSGAYSPAQWDVNPAGIIIGLSSGFLFAAYSLLGKTASHRGLNPWTTMTYTFAFATVFMFLMLQLSLGERLPILGGIGNPDELFWLGRDWVAWGILITLAVGPTLGGYGLYTVSLTLLPASVANLITLLEPPLTTALAYLLLGERMTSPQILGAVIIVLGLVVHRFAASNKR
ncbi:MAG: EamA family transporter [Anaerolineales bacterium]|nr:EamA family transporter [Anaerolineales bacterium]